MRMYTWLTDNEFVRYSQVKDEEMNKILQDVRKVMPEVFVQERIETTKRLFRKSVTTAKYQVYHRINPEFNEVYCVNISCRYYSVCSYLFGLHNGYHYLNNRKTQ